MADTSRFPLADLDPALRVKIESAPSAPGVYIFRDDRGKALYVGKSVTLRARVKSYFQATRDGRLMIPIMLERVRDLELIVTASEQDALVLETNLITKLRPPFNIQLKDDKTYISVCVTTRQEWPRALMVRAIQEGREPLLRAVHLRALHKADPRRPQAGVPPAAVQRPHAELPDAPVPVLRHQAVLGAVRGARH